MIGFLTRKYVIAWLDAHRIVFLLFICLYHQISFSQVSISQVEGFLEVYHPNDHSSLYLGIEAGKFAHTDTEKFNTFIGYIAGFSNNSGFANTFVGSKTGFLNKTGFGNCFLGAESGSTNDSGNFNSFFGNFSGWKNVTGYNNNFFGANAGAANEAGFENSFFGFGGGSQNVNGNQNSFFGSLTGNSFQGGSNNTFLGHKAGSKILLGFNNLCIGNDAGPIGPNAQISNQLFIDVEESNTPLIFGEFDNDILQINGSLIMGNTNHFNGNDDGLIRSSASVGSDLFLIANDAVIVEIGDNATEDGTFEIWNQDNSDVLLTLNEAGNLTTKGTVNGSSDINRKENIKEIDTQHILSKIIDLPVTEWQYKGEDQIRHIGPMAQDFRRAFGLGVNETSIAMVDADGVLIAALQALADENKELKAQLIELTIRVDHLESKSANPPARIVE